MPMPIGPPPNTAATRPGCAPLRSTACHATANGSTMAAWRGPSADGATCSMDRATTGYSARSAASGRQPVEGQAITEVDLTSVAPAARAAGHERLDRNQGTLR